MNSKQKTVEAVINLYSQITNIYDLALAISTASIVLVMGAFYYVYPQFIFIFGACIWILLLICLWFMSRKTKKIIVEKLKTLSSE